MLFDVTIFKPKLHYYSNYEEHVLHFRLRAKKKSRGARSMKSCCRMPTILRVVNTNK